MRDSDTLKFFWRATKRYPLLLTATMAAAAIAVSADAGLPLLIAHALDRLAKGSVPLSAFELPAIVLAVLQATSVLGWHFGIRWLWTIETRVRRDLAQQTFNHIQEQSEQFHLDNFGGALVADQTKFLSAYERLFDEAVFSYWTTLVTVVFIFAALVWTMAWFVIALAMMAGLYLVVGVRSRRRELPLSEGASRSHSRQTSQLADTVTNIATVRSFGRERHEDGLYKGRTQKYVSDEMSLMHRNTRGFLAAESVNRMTLLVVVGLAIFAVEKWHQPVGSIFLVVSYTQSLFQRLHQVQRSLKFVVKSLGDSRSMMGVLATEPSVQDVEDPAPFVLHAGATEFRNVNFGYPNRERLFHDLNLSIEAGQRIGLVGPSGGGKTTLSKLVLRFIDVQGGQILIDGQDISSVSQADLRQQVTYVPQEPLLFHRSIADNIAYGQPEATEMEIVEAAAFARATEFIDVLPKGYETLVGERGTKLSGGQRQRVALARAFLKRTPLLILDEATSALDSHSEALIQQALRELMVGQTAIVIAHRLSTVAGLDRIVVIDAGQILEDGSHDELLAQGGVYAGLWARQSGGFIAER